MSNNGNIFFSSFEYYFSSSVLVEVDFWSKAMILVVASGLLFINRLYDFEIERSLKARNTRRVLERGIRNALE
jgi:hypothetical protein